MPYEKPTLLVPPSITFIDSATESIACLKTAIELLTDEGRFSMAAKYHKEIGEIYEQELDYEHATTAFQAAADMYEGESSQRLESFKY
jgi:alpha-soluble NSF attachment protein